MRSEIKVGSLCFVRGRPETVFRFVALVQGRRHRARVKPTAGDTTERQVEAEQLLPFTQCAGLPKKAVPR